MKKSINVNKSKTVGFFYRRDNSKAISWTKKIKKWLKRKYPYIRIVENRPDVLIALGGDGVMLEAARIYKDDAPAHGPIIIGLNLGRVGFLASVRDPKKFLSGLDQFFRGDYKVTERIMISTSVSRKNKKIFKTESLNDVIAQNLLGVAEIEVSIQNHPIQYIRGTGVLVSTATGSTAYNLSAHGPILMPTLKCLIVSEILDHNIPTPSIVLDASEEVKLKIIDFREHNLLAIRKTKKAVDMLLSADRGIVFPLKIGDIIRIRRSPHLVKFAELEKNYFFKSLAEKFAFK